MDGMEIAPCVMPAGTYYVGDLCYVLGDRWGEFCDLTINGMECLDGQFTMKDGTSFATYRTAYGDGQYSDNLGNVYGVDAGLIGCVKIDSITDKTIDLASMGAVHTFERPFICYRTKDGEIRFGNVRIDTGSMSEDFYYDEDEEAYI